MRGNYGTIIDQGTVGEKQSDLETLKGMTLEQLLAWHKQNAYWSEFLGWVIRVDNKVISFGRDDEVEEHFARFLMFVARAPVGV